MSKECAQAVGSKISGVKLIVLDEISMINLQTLNEISERQVAAMSTQQLIQFYEIVSNQNILGVYICCLLEIFIN